MPTTTRTATNTFRLRVGSTSNEPMTARDAAAVFVGLDSLVFMCDPSNDHHIIRPRTKQQLIHIMTKSGVQARVESISLNSPLVIVFSLIGASSAVAGVAAKIMNVYGIFENARLARAKRQNAETRKSAAIWVDAAAFQATRELMLSEYRNDEDREFRKEKRGEVMDLLERLDSLTQFDD